MAPPSPSSADPRDVIEAQIRECFGRVVYSHKTHEKCADLVLDRLSRIKIWQIVLAAVTATGGFAATFNISDLGKIGAIVTALLSTALLVLNAYTKDNDLGQIAQEHKQAASALWLVREKYTSLLADLRARQKALERITTERDALLQELHAVYKGAPATNSVAYRKAQTALQVNEDMTFSDKEIDAFLPQELRRQPDTPSPS